uniref:WD domain, G-beta repeat, putative n=1 Tax=Theileria annulata TaxID=5874 RepID=A0A3B0MMD4_THEAN
MNTCFFKSDKDLNCLAFHPTLDLLVSGSINGHLDIFKFDENGGKLVKESSNSTTHSSSVRISKFSPDGTEIMSASSDKTVSLTDFHSNKVKWTGKGHKNPVNCACYIKESILASGDDEGEIRIWDTRAKSSCIGKINEFSDCVTDLMVGRDYNELIATCADQIGCFDHRKFKLKALSDNTDHEFLAMTLVKKGKKVICGTSTGSICFFTYGFWGDLNDIIPVNKETVNGIAKVTEDLVCTCGDDGEIYVVQLFPNKVLGKLKDFKNLDVKVRSTDSLTINHNNTLLGFLANFEYIFLTSIDEANRLLSDDKQDFFDEI